MNVQKRWTAWTALAVIACSCSPAFGSFIVYSDQATFLADASIALNLEDFEDETLFGTNNTGNVSNLSVTDIDISTSIDALKLFGIPLFGNDNTTPSGSQYLSLDTDTLSSGVVATFTFDEPLYVLGFNLIDAETPSTLEFAGASYSLGGGPDGNVTFWGIISTDPLSSSFTLDTGSDTFVSLDDIYYASSPAPPVPEPASIALLGTGLVFLAARRKRAQD